MFIILQEQPSPFKTIIEVIVGYFMGKGQKVIGKEKTRSEVKTVSIERSSLNEPTLGDTIMKSGLTTNQTSVDHKLIHLTSSTTSHAPNLGAVYDSLLQEEMDKPVTAKTTPDETIHSKCKSLEKSQETNPSKTLATSSARHGSRPRDMMVTSTARPVIVTGSKSRMTKLSHKLIGRVEQDTTDPQYPTKTEVSIPTTSRPAVVISKQEREDIKPATVDSMVNRRTPAVGQMKQV